MGKEMTRKVTIRDPKPWERTVGDLVYKARYDQNITQEELAATIGVKQKQISHLERNTERGASAIRAAKLAKVFEVLGYDPDLAYYKVGMLPPDVVEITTNNWKLFKGVVDAARSVKK